MQRHSRSKCPWVSLFGAALLCLWLLCPASAWATGAEGVSITGSRVQLKDVMLDCPEGACQADLGAAPPAGVSRVVDVAAMRAALTLAGQDARQFASMKAVRVVSASRALSPAELGELVRPAIERVVPPGVELRGVEAKAALVVPLLSEVGECALAALPKRAGPITTTALVDIMHEGVLVRRVPILVRLVISAGAARPDVPRGHALTLLIEQNSATISTDGVALKDTAIGEVGPFKVLRTGKIVNARVRSKGVAVLLESQ